MTSSHLESHESDERALHYQVVIGLALIRSMPMSPDQMFRGFPARALSCQCCATFCNAVRKDIASGWGFAAVFVLVLTWNLYISKHAAGDDRTNTFVSQGVKSFCALNAEPGTRHNEHAWNREQSGVFAL